jgi:hypothetical protein
MSEEHNFYFSLVDPLNLINWHLSDHAVLGVTNQGSLLHSLGICLRSFEQGRLANGGQRFSAQCGVTRRSQHGHFLVSFPRLTVLEETSTHFNCHSMALQGVSSCESGIGGFPLSYAKLRACLTCNNNPFETVWSDVEAFL